VSPLAPAGNRHHDPALRAARHRENLVRTNSCGGGRCARAPCCRSRRGRGQTTGQRANCRLAIGTAPCGVVQHLAAIRRGGGSVHQSEHRACRQHVELPRFHPLSSGARVGTGDLDGKRYRCARASRPPTHDDVPRATDTEPRDADAAVAVDGRSGSRGIISG
jgi:hypothetical protein